MARIAITAMLASAAGCGTPSSPTPASPPMPHSTESVTAPVGQPDSRSIIGVWHGTSQCTIEPSPCEDEVLYYDISAGAGPDDIVLAASKVVGQKEQKMGAWQCQLQRSEHRLDCKTDQGTFRYTINGNRMHGTFDLADGRRYRVIEVERLP